MIFLFDLPRGNRLQNSRVAQLHSENIAEVIHATPTVKIHQINVTPIQKINKDRGYFHQL